MGFLADLRDRRILRFVLAYAAAAWVVLQVADQLVANELLPRFAYPAVLTLVICGAPGALIVAWFHGAKGRQDVPRTEVWMLSVVAVVAVVATGIVVRQATARIDPELAVLEGSADPRNVAVLYFEPRGGGDAEFLAPGLTEALIDGLGSVDGLRVVSRNGSAQFRGAHVAPEVVARTLDAGTLVTGTVAQAGDRVRVEIEAIEGGSGRQFASTRIERPRTELFQLQDELADSVGEFLRRRIGAAFGEARARIGTRSVEAWEALQQAERSAAEGEALVEHGDAARGGARLDEADVLLASAEAADPQWIDPVLRRGWLAYRRSRLGGVDRDHAARWIEVGLGHANRAVARSPTHADALELVATLEYWKYLQGLVPPGEVADQFHRVEDALARSVAIEPNRASAHTTLSHIHLNAGRFPQAKLSAEQAYRHDPFLENANLTLWRLFQASWNLGDAVDSRRACEEGVRRFEEDFRFVQCRLMLLAFPGVAFDGTEAWALVDAFADGSPPALREVNRLRGQLYVAMGLARAGQADSARAVAMRSRADPFLDPLRETLLMEAIVQHWAGFAPDAVESLGAYLAANPAEAERYRRQAQRLDLPWYHAGLAEEPGFRTLIGLR